MSAIQKENQLKLERLEKQLWNPISAVIGLNRTRLLCLHMILERYELKLNLPPDSRLKLIT